MCSKYTDLQYRVFFYPQAVFYKTEATRELSSSYGTGSPKSQPLTIKLHLGALGLKQTDLTILYVDLQFPVDIVASRNRWVTSSLDLSLIAGEQNGSEHFIFKQLQRVSFSKGFHEAEGVIFSHHTFVLRWFYCGDGGDGRNWSSRSTCVLLGRSIWVELENTGASNLWQQLNNFDSAASVWAQLVSWNWPTQPDLTCFIDATKRFIVGISCWNTKPCRLNQGFDRYIS